MRSIKILLFFIIANSVFAMESAYVSLTANDTIYNGFYPLYKYNNSLWIDTNEVLEFIGAKDITLTKDSKLKGRYNFIKTDLSLKSLGGGVINVDGRTLINIEKLESLKCIRNVDFDESKLQLKIYFAFKLKEESLVSEGRSRENINGYLEEEVVTEEWKAFTPGMLNIRYNHNNISKSDSSLSLSFENHLLYGHMKTDYNLRKINGEYDDEISRVTWERDIFNNKQLVLGNVYQSLNTTQLSGETMRGFTISREGGWDYSTRVTRDSIEGYVAPGTIVELYRNNVLIGYQAANEGQYSFDSEWKTGDMYYLRFYYPDGSREQVEVDRINSNELAQNGQFDYELQVGDADDGGTAYKGYIYYGLTGTTTLGIGSYNARDRYEDLNNFVSITSLSRSTIFHKPYSLNASYNEGENDSKSYLVDFSHRFSSAFGYSVFYEDTNSMEDYSTRYDKNLEFSIGGNLKRFGYGFSYDKEWKLGSEVEYYEFSLNKGIRSLYINSDVRKYEDYERYNIGASYYLRKSLIDSIGFNFSRYTDIRDSVEYSIYMNRNSPSIGGASYNIRYSGGDNMENLISFEISYQLDDLFEIGSSGNSKDVNQSGIYLNTGVNFAKDKKIDYSKTRGNGTVKGRVFIDSNSDGVYQEGEELLKGVTVSARNNKSSTNEQGEFIITGINSKMKTELNIKGDNIDIFYAIPEDQLISALPGGLMEFDIPVLEMQTLSGKVSFSEQFYLEEVKEIISKSKISAYNLKTGKVYQTDLEDENYILDLPSGDYKLDLVYSGEQNLTIHNYGDYYVDIKGTESLHEAFQILVSKNEIFEKEVYVVEIKGANEHYSNRLHNVANLENKRKVSYKKESK